MANYAEKYPNLYSRYEDYHNFEAIAEAMEGYFSDFFQLEELDRFVRDLGTPKLTEVGSYLNLFDLCMNKLRPQALGVAVDDSNDLSVPVQIVRRLDRVLCADPTIKSLLVDTLIFNTSRQIGFLEKMVTGELKVGEPLTLLDMRRTLKGLKHLKESKHLRQTTRFPKTEAFHLRNLALESNENFSRWNDNVALFLDFNLKPNHHSKWGVLDLTYKTTPTATPTPTVYCETLLNESEKATLTRVLGFVPHFISPKSDSAASSGYAAVAWLSSGAVTDADAWNFNVDADFGAMVNELSFVFWGGDGQSFPYRYDLKEKKYFSSGFKYVVDEMYPTHSYDGYFQGGFPCRDLAAAAMDGKVGTKLVPVSNLAEVIQCVETYRVKKTDLDPFDSSYRAFIAGFTRTLNASKYATIGERRSELVIPQDFDYISFQLAHETSNTDTTANRKVLYEVKKGIEKKRVKYQSSITNSFDDNLFGASVLILGLVRLQAKKSVLKILLHTKFQLDLEDQTLIISMLRDNAYVTELIVSKQDSPEYNNPSLTRIHDELMPTFARNRWLNENGYLPPLIDNYWKKSAFFWLKYLYKNQDVLSLTNTRSENNVFKECVGKMGRQGLEAVLGYLGDQASAETIRNMYGSQKAAFYFACQSSEFSDCLGVLVDYLGQPSHYFPFKELGVAYQPGNDAALTHLLGQINALDFFERVMLTDCLKHRREFEYFVQTLIERAANEKWVGEIIIPEFDDASKVSIELLSLRSLYTRLNNTITANRHALAEEIELPSLLSKSDFSLPSDAAVETRPRVARNISIAPVAHQQRAETSYPMNRAGGAQLQLQHQIQVEQELQVSQEQERVVINPIEEAIAGQLVDYTNIEALLNGGGCDIYKMTVLPVDFAMYKKSYILVEKSHWGSDSYELFYIDAKGTPTKVDLNDYSPLAANFNRETKIHLADNEASALILTKQGSSAAPSYRDDTYFGAFCRESEQLGQRLNLAAATLMYGAETLLQSLFHTWVNANPQVIAPNAIHSMTIDAAKELLRKYQQLSSGINPDNLPKGFYTQRSKDGYLILCYNPIQGYMRSPNALTLDLDVSVPKVTARGGDFTFFNGVHYRAIDPRGYQLKRLDWQYIQLFARLQPKNAGEDSVNSREFFEKNTFLGLSAANEEKIAKNWKIFWQVWSFLGQDGLEQFYQFVDSNNLISDDTARDLLCDPLSADLKAWVASIPMSEDYLRALGQIYFHKGPKFMEAFLRKMRRIDVVFSAPPTIDKHFFPLFNDRVIGCNPNFCSYITDSSLFFKKMDDMIETLTKPAQGNRLAVWKVVSIKHMEALGFDYVDKLWSGFSLFLKGLKELDLPLEGHEFDGVSPGNMLVVMDRVLTCLQQIPDKAAKRRFLNNLNDFDLTHGGVYYAIKHENFKYVDAPLKLSEFDSGTPTYRPELKDIYDSTKWTHANSCMQMKRTLASQTGFDHQTYTILTAELEPAQNSHKDKLILLIYTQYPTTNIQTIINELDGVNDDYRAHIAWALHQAVYKHGNKKPFITLEAILGLGQFTTRLNQLGRIKVISAKALRGTVLEALSIQQLAERWDLTPGTDGNVDSVLKLFEAPVVKPHLYPDTQYWDAYKLVTLFGMTDVAVLNQFYTETAKMPQFARVELERLMTQLFSVNYESDLSAINSPKNTENWGALLKCIKDMALNPNDPGKNRIEFLGILGQQGLTFKCSKSGDYRAIQDTEDLPAEVGSFCDHQKRLSHFLRQNIAVRDGVEINESLKPILSFLNELQSMPRRYLNEIEPLLSSLEKTPEDCYWSTNYFYGLLMALQVPEKSFPISLLSMIINESAVSAKPIDDIETEFPEGLKDILQYILNSNFSRADQTVLCRIALMEYKNNGNNLILMEVMATIDNELYVNSQRYVFEILAKSKDCNDLENRFEKCKKLLQHLGQGQPEVSQHWANATKLWLRALSMKGNELVETLYHEIQVQNNLNTDKQALILYIVAFSTLDADINHASEEKIKLNHKAQKLIKRLATLDLNELKALAKTYPQQPAPQIDDILKMIKIHQKGVKWDDCLDRFERNPYPEPRADYAEVVASREVDLQRMIAETRISALEAHAPIKDEDTIRLTFIFQYLKAFEQGGITLLDKTCPISELNQKELAAAFKDLSLALEKEPKNDVLRAQLWAVLFEVLGRTTHKYPHLAQQFALIANDICVTANSRVLQLSTGEGKSHFVALRAARHAGQGKVVDICTAKRVLAERDLQDYAGFFDYLGLTSAYIDPQLASIDKTHELAINTYKNAQIHYSTVGDLSLFLDDLSFNGKAEKIKTVKGLHGDIELTRENRVGLFDEFDFIRFDEGRKTEYNYARPTGKTPKEMMWFYQEVNKFYTTQCGGRDFIDEGLLQKFREHLLTEAGDMADRRNTIELMSSDLLQWVQWIQSAHQVHQLEWRIDFTVREENIKVGDESYPMREIIPLSHDNQKMIGSTFSAGVQQLLAVRLNTEAKEGRLKASGYIHDEAQIFHVHPQSIILSSQVAAVRMQKLWGKWEGFSGTISSAQAKSLYHEQSTQVLHVPTNQRDLRTWHAPKFYPNGAEEQRYQELVAQIRVCLAKKQSMLFACKNDKQVVDLKRIFMGVLDENGRLIKEGMFTEEEKIYFDFYTNEDSRSASDVLKHKEDKEHWQGGKKQQGVALVASGFGRGDNVGVEAVFLLDVSDTNDKLQKGGRTARNGEEGEVFQFYLDADVQTESERCYRNLERIRHQQDQYLPNVEIPTHKISGEKRTQSEIVFERLMLLREYEFSLQNIANQGYHGILAEFSSWIMTIFAKSDLDLTQKDFLTEVASERMQMIEKEWLSISTKDNSDAAKINLIREYIKKLAAELSVAIQQEGIHLTDLLFKAEEYKAPKIEPGTFQVRSEPTKRMCALSTICAVQSRLAGTQVGMGALAKISNNLIQLVQADDELLEHFANKATFAKNMDDFERILFVTLSIMSGESAKIMQATHASYDSYPKFFKALKPNTQDFLTAVLDEFPENIRRCVIKSLLVRDSLSANAL